MRRQLTLFLPPAQRATIDSVRRVIDPLQHAIIPAHVTLCRDEELEPWPDIAQRLAGLGGFAFVMQFAPPEVLADGCVLLRPTAGADQYRELRRRILGPLATEHGAHITLLHPRNARGAQYNLGPITSALAGLSIMFRTVSLIEQHDAEPWTVRQSVGPTA